MKTLRDSLRAKLHAEDMACARAWNATYKVGTVRAAGLEARWSRTSAGAPIIVAREPGRKTWFAIDRDQWTRASQIGIKEAFVERTALGDFFSVPI